MPYIKPENRLVIRAGGAVSNAGELNFAIMELALNYLALNGRDYQSFSDILGAIEGAKLELYRRAVAPYEDTKIAAHGDIAGLAL